MKKVISLVLSMVMLISVIAGVEISAQAAGNSIASATSISLNTTYSGNITSTNNTDVYKFTMSTSGRINVKLTAYIYRMHFRIYDINGNEVWSNNYVYWNDNTKQIQLNTNVDLIKGTYYFSIIQYDGTGNYNFSLNFTSANETQTESYTSNNNSIADAYSINLNQTYKGQIANNDNTDIFKFVMSNSGRINLKLTAYIYRMHFRIYDINGNEVWSNNYVYWNDNTKQIQLNTNIDLIKGTYYFSIIQYDGTGNYNYSLNYTSADETLAESYTKNNNSIADSYGISLGNTYKGQIANNDDTDIYRFNLSSSSTIKLNVTAYIYRMHFRIYDINGNEVWSMNYVYWNDNTKKITINEKITLSKGTYYLSFIRYDGTGNYNFSVNRVINVAKPSIFKASSRTTSSIKVTWGKVSGVKGYLLEKKVGSSWKTVTTTTSTSYTVKSLSAGTVYNFRVRAYKVVDGKKYYSSAKTLTATTKIATPTIKTPSTNTKHQIRVNWNKSSLASGYQVQYCSNSGCTKVIATKTVSGQSKEYYVGSNFTKGRTYYVRVRAYRNVNGTKIYSNWSSVKSIKCK